MSENVIILSIFNVAKNLILKLHVRPIIFCCGILCDNFASDCSSIFLYQEIKVFVHIASHRIRWHRSEPLAQFFIGGDPIQLVDEWSQLGHILQSQMMMKQN